MEIAKFMKFIITLVLLLSAWFVALAEPVSHVAFFAALSISWIVFAVLFVVLERMLGDDELLTYLAFTFTTLLLSGLAGSFLFMLSEPRLQIVAFGISATLLAFSAGSANRDFGESFRESWLWSGAIAVSIFSLFSSFWFIAAVMAGVALAVIIFGLSSVFTEPEAS